MRAFAAGFYGNDPAGTLLFWRGWSLHDRQTRLRRRARDSADAVHDERRSGLSPFAETDHRPGVYGGLEWRYARRALVQLARYDNRADPYSFSDGQWGWGTDFNHLAVQVSLPAELGLVVQWMDGATEWLTAALPNGTRLPISEYAHDEFESRFVMLTRRFGADAAARAALRHVLDRAAGRRARAATATSGHAWTLSYRIEPTERFSGGVEWLRIDSQRDLWPMFYATRARAHRRSAAVAVLLPARRSGALSAAPGERIAATPANGTSSAAGQPIASGASIVLGNERWIRR